MDRITKEFVFNGTAKDLLTDVRKFCTLTKRRGGVLRDGIKWWLRSPTFIKAGENEAAFTTLHMWAQGKNAEEKTGHLLDSAIVIYVGITTTTGDTEVRVEALPEAEGLLDEFLASYKGVQRAALRQHLEHHQGMIPYVESVVEVVADEKTNAETPIKRGRRKQKQEDDRRAIVEKYLEIQSHVTQRAYAGQNGIDERTLRRWVNEYKTGSL